MIVILRDFDAVDGIELPFIPYIPDSEKVSDISLRVNDDRWPTLRFFVTQDRRRLRVKEFFMDWFFTGFPKALMSSFTDSYSPVDLTVAGSMHIYTGINYRGRSAASAYCHGTEIEIEADSPMAHQDFVNLLTHEFAPMNHHIAQIQKKQFPDRSFFAHHRSSDWYEDQRISRLTWEKSPQNQRISFNGHLLSGSGYGSLSVGDKKQSISIFEENNYERVIWIESADKRMELDHKYYIMRHGKGLYSKFSKSDNYELLFRDPDGPGVIQSSNASHIITVAVCAGFGRGTEESMVGLARELLSLPENS